MRQSQDLFIYQQGFSVPNANPHLYTASIPAHLYHVLRRTSSWMPGVPVGKQSPHC